MYQRRYLRSRGNEDRFDGNKYRLRYYICYQLRLNNHLLGYALTLVELKLYKLGLATASVFYSSFAAALTVFLFTTEADVLRFLAAPMMCQAEAADIGSQQANQHDCDKLFHEKLMNV